jgi:cell division protein ZapA
LSQVNVTINSKHYRMACDDGQEAHLAGLAERLNGAIETLRDRFGEIGDQRLTVMAAIMFADQSAEAARRVALLEAQLTEAHAAHAASAESGAEDASAAASAVLAAAERIESFAGKVGSGSKTRGP